MDFTLPLHFSLGSLLVCMFIGTPQARTEQGKQFNNTCIPLNKFIQCYEEMQFTHISFENDLLILTYSAFGEHVTLILYKNSDPDGSFNSNNILKPNLNIHVINDMTSQIYQHLSEDYFGKVEGKPGSKVYGRFAGNIFNGKVEVSDQTFYIEDYKKYFTFSSTPKMVIYRDSDIVYWKYKSSQQKKMQNYDQDRHRSYSNLSYIFPNHIFQWQSGKEIKEYPFTDYEIHLNVSNRKYKRSASSQTSHICDIEITVDHLFFEHVGLNSVPETIGEIVFYMTEANDIFRATDFNGDGVEDNVGFMVTSMVIYETLHAENNLMGTSDNVDIILDNFSLYDHSSACLGLLYTYRDFADGVIGLAWVASSNLYDVPGGICQERVDFNGELMSFNSLLVSTLNFGARVPTKVSALTTAHELGHAFGAPHDQDFDVRCAPGGFYGHYLMHPYSSDASMENNRKFSPCSIESISPVIDAKSHLCFREMDMLTCGNQLVEQGEECDCGNSGQCDVFDKCCVPYDSSNPSTGCRINTNAGYTCSPLRSTCCDPTTCHVKNRNEVCREATECIRETRCDGLNADCPTGVKEPNGKLCHSGTKVCVNGECTQSVCEWYGLEECQCTDYPSTLCDVCCKCSSSVSQGQTDTCVPAWGLNVTNHDRTRIYRIAGTSCSNYQGFCNEEHYCVSADPDGALNRLKNYFDEGLAGQMSAIGQNFWAFFVFFAVGSIVVGTAIKMKHEKRKQMEDTTVQTEVLSNICNAAQSEYSALVSQLEEIGQNYENQVDRLGCYTEMESDVAYTRLSTFFPTASREDIDQALQESSNEEEAVRYFLLKDFPLQKLCDTEYDYFDLGEDNDDVLISVQNISNGYDTNHETTV